MIDEMHLCNKEDLLKLIENHIEELKIRSHTFALGEISNNKELLGRNIFFLISRLAHYSLHLNVEILDAFRSKKILPAIFMIRAQYEATGIIASVDNLLNDYQDNRLSFNFIDDFVERYLLGSSVIKFDGEKAPERISIMNGIDKVDKWYEQLTGEKENNFRARYNYISEFCHPNLPSLSVTSHLEDGVLFNREQSQNFEEFFMEFYNALKVANIVFPFFYDSIINRLISDKDLRKYVIHKNVK